MATQSISVITRPSSPKALAPESLVDAFANMSLFDVDEKMHYRRGCLLSGVNAISQQILHTASKRTFPINEASMHLTFIKYDMELLQRYEAEHLELSELPFPDLKSPADKNASKLLKNFTVADFKGLPEKLKRIFNALKYLTTPLEILATSPKTPRTCSVSLPKMTHAFMQDALLNKPPIKEGLLGKGCFGQVSLAKTSDGHPFALKESNPKKEAQTAFTREAAIYMSVKHPRIVEMQALSPNGMYLTLAKKGSLYSLIGSAKLTSNQLQTYFLDITDALLYLHEQGLHYKDLKPENVLINDDGHAYLCDFGLATFDKDDIEKTGSPLYQAPEIIVCSAEKPLSHAVDNWSLGVLIYKMITGGVYPFPWIEYKGVIEPAPKYLHRISKQQLGKPCNPALFTPLNPSQKAILKRLDPTGILYEIAIKLLHGDPLQRLPLESVQTALKSLLSAENPPCSIL